MKALGRLFDLWSALLIGVLVALAIIILFATPGPWDRVVTAPRVQIVPPPPHDVVVFVNGTQKAGQCSGVVWLHVSYAPARVTAIVLPPRLQVRVPGSDYEPLATAVRDFGSDAATKALQEALGVQFGGWVYVRREGLRAAFPGFLPMEGGRASRARLRASGFAWDGRGDALTQFRLQTDFLHSALAASSFTELNLVAFVNFVLGSPACDTNMKLQALAGIGTALKETLGGHVRTSALPARVIVSGGYARWIVDRRALLAFRQSFAFPLTEPPVYTADARRHVVPPRVLVLAAPLPGGLLRAYARGLGNGLRASSGRKVGVDIATVSSLGEAEAALRRVTGDAPPLAVVIAVGRQGGTDADGLGSEIDTLVKALEGDEEPTLVSELPPCPADACAEANAAIAAAAQRNGVALSSVAQALVAPPAVAPRLDATLAHRWGRLNAEALARSVAPQLLARRLQATSARCTPYRRATSLVTVVAKDAGQGAYVSARVANFGFRVQEQPASQFSASSRMLLYYRPDDLETALALAADLRLKPAALRATAAAQSGPVLVLPTRSTP